jgi:hypothetical protein
MFLNSQNRTNLLTQLNDVRHNVEITFSEASNYICVHQVVIVAEADAYVILKGRTRQIVLNRNFFTL